MKILLFGGTTEGRRIAERLAVSDHELTVCVATKNGAEELSGIPGIHILTGEKGEEEIEDLLTSHDLCIDATHPYARTISRTLRESCARTGVPLRRVLRAAEDTGNARTFGSYPEIVRFLEKNEGNVLLAIGTRALPDFAPIMGARVYARILPAAEGIAACEAAGLMHRQIIAMQGPFTKEMNAAMIRQYGIRYIVTKESGKEGGFREKAEAAAECGAELLVMRRPSEEGCPVEQLLHELMPEESPSPMTSGEITLIGCGNVTLGTVPIVTFSEYDLIIGARRLLDALPFPKAEDTAPMERTVPAENTAPIQKAPHLDKTAPAENTTLLQMVPHMNKTVPAENTTLLQKAPHMNKTAPAEMIAATATGDIVNLIDEHPGRRIAVLFSGDTGFYSGAGPLIRRLEGKGLRVKVVPGISSVQYLAAKIGRPWQDWNLCSAHGREIDLFGELRKGRPLFLLTGGGESARGICRELTDLGYGDADVTIGEAFGMEEERVRKGTAASFQEESFHDLCVLLVEVPAEKLPKRRVPGIPDGEFIRQVQPAPDETTRSIPMTRQETTRTIPMTKQEVRATLMAKLDPCEGETAWDIGAGTGSVSVELALLVRDVWAVEAKEEACSLIERNRGRFRVRNLNVIRGRAPEALGELPRPDIVFVGGSEGALGEILDAAFERNPAVRIGVSAISIETLYEAVRWMQEKEFRTEVTEVQVSRGRGVGSRCLMAANNPVFLVTGKRE